MSRYSCSRNVVTSEKKGPAAQEWSTTWNKGRWQWRTNWAPAHWAAWSVFYPTKCVLLIPLWRPRPVHCEALWHCNNNVPIKAILLFHLWAADYWVIRWRWMLGWIHVPPHLTVMVEFLFEIIIWWARCFVFQVSDVIVRLRNMQPYWVSLPSVLCSDRIATGTGAEEKCWNGMNRAR